MDSCRDGVLLQGLRYILLGPFTVQMFRGEGLEASFCTLLCLSAVCVAASQKTGVHRQDHPAGCRPNTAPLESIHISQTLGVLRIQTPPGSVSFWQGEGDLSLDLRIKRLQLVCQRHDQDTPDLSDSRQPSSPLKASGGT